MNAPSCHVGRAHHDMAVSTLGVDYCRVCGWVPTGIACPDGESPFRPQRAGKRARLGGLRRQRRIAELIARDGDGCHYCGCELEDATRTLDEMTPVSRGGLVVAANQVIACKPCNGQKGDTPYDDFVAGLARRAS